jgi:hypothetical protein
MNPEIGAEYCSHRAHAENHRWLKDKKKGLRQDASPKSLGKQLFAGLPGIS